MLEQILKKEIDKSILNDFQINSWNILQPLLRKLDFEKISDKSYVDEGTILDIIIYSKNQDYTLSFSIKQDVFYINSQLYDIYLYADYEKIEKLSDFLYELLKGNYSVENSYNQKEKIIKRKMVFDNNDLTKFNIEEWISVFGREITNKNTVKGVNLIK